MTNWYYAQGNGMLLSGDTNSLYLAANTNLTCPDGELQPGAVGEELTGRAPDEVEDHRGRLSIRQISLLRTQMKTDLAIYGRPYGPTRKGSDKAFLRHCGVSLWRRPWRESASKVAESHG